VADDNDVEESIKEMLDFYQETTKEEQKEAMNNNLRFKEFKSSIDYTSSNFGKLFTFYGSILRVFELELFFSKLSSNI